MAAHKKSAAAADAPVTRFFDDDDNDDDNVNDGDLEVVTECIGGMVEDEGGEDDDDLDPCAKAANELTGTAIGEALRVADNYEKDPDIFCSDGV